MTVEAKIGGYQQQPSVGAKCRNNKCSECTKVNCTHGCHDREKRILNSLDFEKRVKADCNS